MNVHRFLLSAGLLLGIGSTLASASVLPGGAFPALFNDVPEPGSVVMIGCAMLGVLGVARRQSKKK